LSQSSSRRQIKPFPAVFNVLSENNSIDYTHPSMEQARALNALAPFLALAKSATSPRAAADLITQATSAPHTYVFAELLQQPNIQSLAGHEQFAAYHELLKIFAWGTWDSYKGMQNPTGTMAHQWVQGSDSVEIALPDLPPLSNTQALKLRLLSLLTIASQKPSKSAESHLSYASLCARLDFQTPLDLEHLITQAIYNDLINATLNPASQTVVISSVAPLRDLAPGSVSSMIEELKAWSGRCDSVLAGLEAEIEKIRAEAKKRALREQKTEKQVKAVMEEKGNVGGVLGAGRSGNYTSRVSNRRADGDGDDDPMELDTEQSVGSVGGKKRSGGGGGGGFGGLVGKFTGKHSGR